MVQRTFLRHQFFSDGKFKNCELPRFQIKNVPNLEIQLVREHSFTDGEGRSQVLAKELLLGVLLDGADQLTVNLDLVLLALFGDNVSGLLLFEDFTFAVTDFLGLGSAKVIVVQSVRNRNPGNVDLGLGGDDVDLVDSPQWASVDAEGAGDEKQTGSQLLQEHHALSLVDAGYEDQHGARGDGRTQFAVVLAERLLVGCLSLLTRLRGQRARRLLELNDAFLAILLSADFLGNSRSLGRGDFLDGGLVLDKSGFLVVHFRPRELHDTAGDLHVSRSVSHS